MRIAFLNIYNGIVERGSEVFVDEMARQLSRHHDVTVFQIGQPKSTKYESVQIEGIPYEDRCSTFLYHWRVFLFSLKSLITIWKNGYDWIIPINGRAQVILVRLYRFLFGCKILISGHAGIGFDDRFNLQLGKPDVFISLTPQAERWAKKYAGSTPIKMIPNGVNIDQFNPTVLPAALNIAFPTIICVSALIPYKRVHLLIQAVAKLSYGTLLVIGDGPLYDEILNLGTQLLGNRFQLIRYIEYAHIAHYYRSASVFSLPSAVSEAFGLVYVEALACNLPVVAPDDENRRMIIGEGGLYCHVENIDEYASTLYTALSVSFEDKSRKQAEIFSWEAIAEEYEEILSHY